MSLSYRLRVLFSSCLALFCFFILVFHLKQKHEKGQRLLHYLQQTNTSSETRPYACVKKQEFVKIKWKLCNPQFSEHRYKASLNAWSMGVRNLRFFEILYNKTFLSGSVLSDIVEIQFVFLSAWKARLTILWKRKTLFVCWNFLILKLYVNISKQFMFVRKLKTFV